MSKLKISILTHDISGGAFTNLCTALVRSLQKLGADCNLVILNASAAELAAYPDIPIVTLNVNRTVFSLLATIRYLRAERPDVILPMPWYFNIVAIWAKYLSRVNTKVIIGEHNIISLEASIEHRDKLRLRFLPILMRYTYPYGDGLVGVSQDTITDLVETLNIKAQIPMQVILNPIDPNRVQHLARAPIEHPWFQPGQLPTIVTVARLAKQKQLDGLLCAFAQVVKVTPARLLILGEGPLRAELEQLCRDLGIAGSVAMPGYDPNPYRYLANCDLFVLASAWEGCPIALQEAMACGAAVVVTDSPGGMKDIIADGQFGLLVPNGDRSALAQGMLQILTQPDLKQDYRDRSLRRSADFEDVKIAKQYLELCQSVVAGTANRQEAV
jgi:glycosyltransferase involved in cell wall biosynthesis